MLRLNPERLRRLALAASLLATLAGVTSVVVAAADGRGVDWSHLARALGYPLVTLFAFRLLLGRVTPPALSRVIPRARRITRRCS